MREVWVESTYDESSANVPASILRTNGIPVRVVRADAALGTVGPISVGGFDIVVPRDR